MKLYQKVLLIIFLSVTLLLAGTVIMIVILVHVDPFTASKVEKIFPSPDGKYQVEVSSYDEGALGGTTIVQLVEIDGQEKVSTVGETPTGKGVRVATGRWNDYERMNVIWQDEKSFQIIIEYDWTDEKNVMDVNIDVDGIVTSGWYKKTF